MRQFVKNLTYTFSKSFSLNFILTISGEKFIFPFYHLISDDQPDYIKNLYKAVSVKQFETDLEFLLKHYQPATTEDLIEFIRNHKKSSKPYFFLSFDDGMRECYDVVFPILKQKGIQAAFFINTAFVDNKELFYRHKISLIIEKVKALKAVPELNELICRKTNSQHELILQLNKLKYSEQELINKAGKLVGIDFNDYLKEHQPFMTLEQIRELQANGFLIGSHSHDHPKFWEIIETERKQQLIDSFDYIDQNLQPEIRAFAFPFTDYEIPASFFKFLSEKIKPDITFGTAGIKKDTIANHIQRIPMDENLKPAKRIIREEYAYFGLKALFNKNIITRL